MKLFLEAEGPASKRFRGAPRGGITITCIYIYIYIVTGDYGREETSALM